MIPEPSTHPPGSADRGPIMALLVAGVPIDALLSELEHPSPPAYHPGTIVRNRHGAIGRIVRILDDGRALVAWRTYGPEGSTGYRSKSRVNVMNLRPVRPTGA